uniref:GNAT family N-acetyltransferase n=1 Tax=uncultured Sphingomonas sp. TaxID=158754 RepID=UPI0035CA18C3
MDDPDAVARVRLDGFAVTCAVPADRAAIVAMLARAFADDPAMAYIFPDPADRARRLPRLFALLLDSAPPGGLCLVTARGDAATLWRPPGRTVRPMLDLLRLAWPMWRTFGPALGRVRAVSDAIAAHFPIGPHWYLHIAGCDPAVQRCGLGGAAVRAGLARIAPSGLPVYLETAREANLAFYRSLGFTVIDDWTVGDAGPRFWSLLRCD